MKNRLFAIAIMSPVFMSSHSFANQVAVDISDETAHIEVSTEPSRKDLNFSASFLHHEDDGDVYSIGAFVQSPINNRNDLHGALGAKLYYLDADGPDGHGVGLGGELSFKIPSVEKLSIHAEAYYAPKVLAYDDVERFLDTSISLKYRALEQGSIYVGYRKQEVDIKDGERADIDNGAHIGISLQF
ncbi:hypothetical protein A9Q99_20070 [Gammaproteobacteria bacterium 45_16_T64]|nr:hypothetical protein A9Q99_20070 [Gammaproteobacteria bacterium 45_16_T64]